MTSVYAQRSGHRCILEARGHATGSEQVCAAVSGILYALAGYLTNAVHERYIELYRQEMDSGDVTMDYNGDEGTTAAFEMAVIGLQQIEASYPAYIRVVYQQD